VLVEMLRRNDPRVVRRGIRSYLRYLDGHGSVAPRLRQAGVAAWVVHGESGDGGIGEVDRRLLEASPVVQLVTIPGTSFFTPNEEPALVADLVRKAFVRTGDRSGSCG
jgi:pimeloyl-ACP methyl ester carboxylesterase